jgi:hypothetical protein
MFDRARCLLLLLTLLLYTQTLCEALLKNYVSTTSQVVSLSLRIFLALIRNFRVRAVHMI